MLLGASVGEAVDGRQAGWRAAGWGAVCGTLPDLDVFLSYGGPVADFTYHRGFSHSLFVLTLAAPVIWWLISRIDKRARAAPRRWLLLVWLALITHPLLDALTVYGTQLFLPFSNYPVGLSSVFIIDPVVTLSLALGLLLASLARRRASASRAAVAGLAAAGAYLALGLAAKAHVDSVVRETLAASPAKAQAILTTPAPFNILLWRIVVVDPDGYLEGYYSLLDAGRRPVFDRHASHPALLDDIADSRDVRRLKWFTKGFYRVRQLDGLIVMTDLRMGGEPYYAFSFVVGEYSDDEARSVPAKRLDRGMPHPREIGALLGRILHAPPGPAELSD